MNEAQALGNNSTFSEKLSVIIPAYNEEHRIEETLLSVSEFLKKQPYQSEILVISDGSKDRTPELVSTLTTQIPNLVLIENKDNHGKGWVVKQGMLQARGSVRVFMDADNSTKIDEINKFLPYFKQGFDVVIGSRRIQGAVIATHQGFIRDFLGGVFRFIVHTLVPVGVTDSQCGFKAFTAQATERVFPKQTIFRWAFDVEILALTRRAGLKIKEVPITWINDSESHVKFSGMVKMLLEVLQTRLNLWTGKYNEKV
jgi:dolichyl-phosphate beta-glucosyltransferase